MVVHSQILRFIQVVRIRNLVNEGRNYIPARRGMGLHDFKLFVCQFAGLIQNHVRYIDFADVMQRCRAYYVTNKLIRQLFLIYAFPFQFFQYDFYICRCLADMVPSILIPVFYHVGQGEQERVVHLTDRFVFVSDIRYVLDAVVGHFYESPVQVFNLVTGTDIQLADFCQIVFQGFFVVKYKTVRSFCHRVDRRYNPARQKRGYQQNDQKDTGKNLGQPLVIPFRVIPQMIHGNIHCRIALTDSVIIVHRRIDGQQPAKLIIGNNRIDFPAF